jgi:hypothetical protein
MSRLLKNLEAQLADLVTENERLVVLTGELSEAEFGAEQFGVINFQELLANRAATVESTGLCCFLFVTVCVRQCDQYLPLLCLALFRESW